MKQLARVMVAIALALPGACGGDEPCDATGTDRAFGECCSEDAQCADGLCHEFGDGTQACTASCSADADCPEGSQGKKCNNQGVCRV